MQVLLITSAIDLSLLHNELIAAVPGFHRVTVKPEGNVADADCGQVGTANGETKITFSEDIPPDLVTAVVQAHDPANAPPDSSAVRRDRIAAILAIARSQ